MSKQGVEELLGRMMLDEVFRQAVVDNPAKAAAAFDLTAEERDQFRKLDLSEFSGMISDIWNRASLAFGRNLN